MNALATLLFVAAFSIPTSSLILRSGARIDVDGSVAVDSGRVIFRSGGQLFSIPSADVDLDATRAAGVKTPTVYAQLPNRLRVTREERDRLLHDLEQNHSGTPAPIVNLPAVTMEQDAAQRERATGDEWSWKVQAQAKEEAIRRAQEQLDLLRNRADELATKIQTLFALGYKPEQFSYDAAQLEFTREAIPNAELAVTQAQRDYDQFRDNARRLGVMPGWLR